MQFPCSLNLHILENHSWSLFRVDNLLRFEEALKKKAIWFSNCIPTCIAKLSFSSKGLWHQNKGAGILRYVHRYSSFCALHKYSFHSQATWDLSLTQQKGRWKSTPRKESLKIMSSNDRQKPSTEGQQILYAFLNAYQIHQKHHQLPSKIPCLLISCHSDWMAKDHHSTFLRKFIRTDEANNILHPGHNSHTLYTNTRVSVQTCTDMNACNSQDREGMSGLPMPVDFLK